MAIYTLRVIASLLDIYNSGMDLDARDITSE